jgi:cohesin complex subunit SCC1
MRLIFVSLLGLSEELNELHNRTYEAIVRPAVQSMELQGQFDMPETIPEDSNIAGFGAATINDPLHIPDGIQSDALLSGANDACDATPAFGLQIPPDNQVNGASNDFVIGTLFPGVTEPFIDNEKEVALADREHAQVDTLYSDRLQDVPSDLQSTDANVSSQDVALDNSGRACALPGDDMTGEFNHFVHSHANIFESNEVPASEITGVEYNQDASGFPRPTEDENAVGYNQDSSGFPRPTEDENAVSAMGDNSGFQENNMGSLMDLDMVNDYELKECNVSPFTHIQNLQML